MTSQIDLAGGPGRLSLFTWPSKSAHFAAVLVHGYADHAQRFVPFATALGEVGGQVYAVDYPGHGLSAGDRAVLLDLDDLVAVTELVVSYVQVVAPSLPLVLIGQSLGGAVAARYVQLNGETLSALVLASPAVGHNSDLARLANLPELPEVILDPALFSPYSDAVTRYAEDPLVYHGAFSRETVHALVASEQQLASGGSLGPLPTLWLHGALDPLAPLIETEPAIARIAGPNLEKHVFPERYHELLNDSHAQAVVDRVISFLRRNNLSSL